MEYYCQFDVEFEQLLGGIQVANFVNAYAGILINMAANKVNTYHAWRCYSPIMAALTHYILFDVRNIIGNNPDAKLIVYTDNGQNVSRNLNAAIKYYLLIYSYIYFLILQR
jgi:hypothetical protein